MLSCSYIILPQIPILCDLNYNYGSKISSHSKNVLWGIKKIVGVCIYKRLETEGTSKKKKKNLNPKLEISAVLSVQSHAIYNAAPILILVIHMLI